MGLMSQLRDDALQKERVKRLAGDGIELGMMISMIEPRAGNIPMTKGATYVVMQFDR